MLFTYSLQADPETGEQFMFGENEFHQLQMTIPNSQTGTIPYPSKESGGEAFGSIISLQTEHGVIDGPSKPSIGASGAPSDIAITEAFTVIEHSSLIQKERIDEPRFLSAEHIECIEGHVSPSHEPPDTPAAAEAFQNRGNVQSGNENEFLFPTLLERHGSQHDVMAGKGIDVSDDVQMIDNDGNVDSNLHGQQPLDNRIGSGDNALNVNDGFVGPVDSGGNAAEVLESLVSLAIQPHNIDDGFVGPIDSARSKVKVLEGVVSLGVQLVENGVGSGDDAQMVVELPVVSDLHREQSLSTATGSGDRKKILAKDDSVGLESSEQKPVDGVEVDSIQIFEDASSGLDSPGHRPIDNLRGLCENSQTFEDALVGPDSSEQRAVENVDGSSGDNSQVFEDAPADLDPLVESEVIVDHNVKTAESNLPALNSHDHVSADNRPDSSNGARTEGVEFVALQNVTDLGDNVEMEEAGSNRREPGENDSIDLRANEQILEINLVVQVSPQREDNDAPVIISNSVAPDSPSQHPAKRPRLSPSEERRV